MEVSRFCYVLHPAKLYTILKVALSTLLLESLWDEDLLLSHLTCINLIP